MYCALQALEKIHREKYGGGGTATQFEDEIVPPLMRRSIAVYEAARCLIGYMTPYYDEISKVSFTQTLIQCFVCTGSLLVLDFSQTLQWLYATMMQSVLLHGHAAKAPFTCSHACMSLRQTAHCYRAGRQLCTLASCVTAHSAATASLNSSSVFRHSM